MSGFCFLIASAIQSREQVIPIGLTVILIVCSIGGCWWPLFIEPLWLQQFAHVFLTSWAMGGLQDLILREWALAEILPALAFLFSYGIASAALGSVLYRRIHLRPGL
jgi:ABC-2 type transport system permease protein